MNCIIFHKWGKWEEYKANMVMVPGILAPKNIQGKEIEYIECRQRRKCYRCGKIEDTKIGE